MSFDDFERSNYDGRPCTYYEFSLGSSRWRYTDAESDRQYGGQTYTAVPIKHGEITMSGDPSADDFTVTISAAAPITSLFAGMPPSEAIHLAVREVHRGDTTGPVIWSGLVKSGRGVSAAEFEFTCNSLLSTLDRNGLRLSWGRNCPHALYDFGCKVDPADYAVAIQITTVVGNRLHAAAFNTFANGYFAGGLVVYQGPHGASERKAVESHTGDTIALLGPSDGLLAGDWITAYPGCNRTSAMCLMKFNNLDNYGGFPHLPTKSPFDGDPVF